MIFFIRIAQWLNAIIVLGLAGHTLSDWGSEGSAGYAVFATVITLLAIPWFVFAPGLLSATAHPLAAVILEIFLNVVWFTSWIALAGVWGPVTCGNRDGWWWDSSACKTAKAAAGMGALEWLLFIVSTVLVITSAMSYLRARHYSGPFTPFDQGGIVAGGGAGVASAGFGSRDVGVADHKEMEAGHVPEGPQEVTPPEPAAHVAMPEPDLPNAPGSTRV